MARLETSLDARRTSTKGEVVSFIGGGKREIKKEKKGKKEEARRSGSIGGMAGAQGVVWGG